MDGRECTRCRKHLITVRAWYYARVELSHSITLTHTLTLDGYRGPMKFTNRLERFQLGVTKNAFYVCKANKQILAVGIVGVHHDLSFAAFRDSPTINDTSIRMESRIYRV